jgi:hypothetical protein
MRYSADKVSELFFSFEGGLAPIPTIEASARSLIRLPIEGITMIDYSIFCVV